MNVSANHKSRLVTMKALHQFLLASFIILNVLFGTSNAQTGGTDFRARPVDGDTLQLGLQEAILLALERNPTVTIQRLQPRIMRTYAAEERDVFDPELALSMTKSQTKLQRFLGARPDPFEMTSDRFQYDVGVSETLPTGTTISASATMSGSMSSIYSDQYSGGVGITITQALLQGFGIGPNLADLRKANVDVEISEAELKGVAEQVVANIENAYWEIYLAAKEIEIQTKSLDLANRQLDESLERVAVGKLPELELAAVHAEVATRQGALIDAQSRYEQARLRLLFLLNPSDENFWSTVPLPVDRPFVPLDTLDAVSIHEQLGVKYRSDLRQARLALEKGELDVVQTKNGLLPQLDLFVTLGRTSYARTLRDALPDIQSPFYDISGGLSFTFPVPNRGARAQAARARYSREQMVLSLKNMERTVQWDIRSSHDEVLRARQQIEATRITRELQERKLGAEQEKFRVGKSTNLLVLQVQRDLTASELDEARAMVSYLNALVDLYLMEGTLLNRRGINNLNPS